MRKQDYETLARELRRRIDAPKKADMLSQHWQENAGRIASDAQCAASLARYCAEHLAVDRAAFLTACGLRP